MQDENSRDLLIRTTLKNSLYRSCKEVNFSGTVGVFKILDDCLGDGETVLMIYLKLKHKNTNKVSSNLDGKYGST